MLATRKQNQTIEYHKETADDIQPLSLKSAAVLFGIPAIAFILATYVFIPFLEANGVPPLQAMTAAFSVPMALLLVAALVGYIGAEDRPALRQAFADRMWFNRITLKDLLWTIPIFVVGILSTGAGMFVEQAIVNSSVIPIPANIPLLFDPTTQLSTATLEHAAGGPLAGQWGLVLLYGVYIFFNIAGEELWWRGYILPRQIARHGKSAWVIHGVMWTLFHAFRFWSFLGILPLSLMMAYVSQRTRSNWPALFGHLLGNMAFFAMITLGAMGL